MMKKKRQRALAGTPTLCHPAKKRLTFEEALRRTQKKHVAIILALENN